MDAGEGYQLVATRLGELARTLDPEVSATAVPSCPGWSVHDVLAHVAGGCSDVLAQNMDGAPGQAWTAKQVADRRDLPLEQIVTEWQDGAPRLAAALAGRHGVLGQALFDALTHEYDVREALGRRGDADDPAAEVAWDWAWRRFSLTAQERGLPLPQFRAEVGTVERLRAISGRRTREQVESITDGDLAASWPAFTWAVFSPPQD